MLHALENNTGAYASPERALAYLSRRCPFRLLLDGELLHFVNILMGTLENDPNDLWIHHVVSVAFRRNLVIVHHETVLTPLDI